MSELIEYPKHELELLLNEQQKHFCHEILFNNRVQSYMAAYPDCEYKSASASATRLLEDVRINQYVSFLKLDIETITGVSKIRQVNELAKIAYTSISNLHNTWISLIEFESIPEAQRAAIESIETKTVVVNFDETTKETEFVKIKLYSKIAAITEINKMMGYNAAEKRELTGKDGKDLISPKADLSKLSKETLDKMISELDG